MKKHIKRILSAAILSTMAISFLPSNISVFAVESKTQKVYEIYPKPQKIDYTGGEFQLEQNVNVVYDNGVDEYTKNRVLDVLKSQNLEATVSSEIVLGKTNFLV
ncbi:MAG: glycoside hydrolase family 20 zincin-like fold domain-containing protein, partial [Sarcina sp.]